MRLSTATIVILLALGTPAAGAESWTDYLYWRFGGMRPGSGIAAGLELRNDHFRNGAFDLRVESKVSIRLYQQHEIELIDPHFLDERVSLEVLGLYRSYTQVDFFGVGPESREEDHSDYDLNGFAAFATVAYKPGRRTQIGLRSGYLQAELGPGTDDELPDINETFDASALPGFDASPSHVLVGAFVTFDYRDDPEDPHFGGYYEVQTTRYEDLGFESYAFSDLDYDVQHFVPLGERFTLALRASGVFTRTADGQSVPFYLLPSLGGTESLHAFENDRFRDRHMLFLNNELRYRASPTIRLEVFVDAGEVFPRFDAFRFDALSLSYGAGARYKFGTSILMGVSVGFGREGVRAQFQGDFRF